MIVAVVIVLGVVVFVLVGTPLLAWWVGGCRSWRRSCDPADPYLSREAIRRHELGPTELTVVERAATWGRTVHDDRLRAAVVELAERQVRTTGGPRLPPMWLVVLFAAYRAVLAGYLASEASQGRWTDSNWLNLVSWLVVGVLGWRWQTGPQRAVRLNSSPPPPRQV